MNIKIIKKLHVRSIQKKTQPFSFTNHVLLLPDAESNEHRAQTIWQNIHSVAHLTNERAHTPFFPSYERSARIDGSMRAYIDVCVCVRAIFRLHFFHLYLSYQFIVFGVKRYF